MSVQRDFELTLALVSPFLFQGLTNTRIGVDVAFLRDEDGYPVIPAAQIRGVVKAALAALHKAGFPGINLANWFGDESIKVGGSQTKHDEPNRGALIFSDLTGPKPADGLEATRIEIDDDTGAVKRGALQVIELAAPFGRECVFTGKVVFRGSDADAVAAELAIAKALKLIPAIGALKSAGFGRVEPASCRFARKGEFALKPAVAASAPRKDQPLVFDVTFDRPVLANSHRVAENMFEGASIIPGAAFKGALAERLRLASLKPESDPGLSLALAQLRFSHAFPLSDGKIADAPLPMSVLIDANHNFFDISGWSTGDVPLQAGKAADFLVSAKDKDKTRARDQLDLPKFKPVKLARTHIAMDGERLIANDEKLYSTVMIGAKNQKWRLKIDFGNVRDADNAKLLRAAIGSAITGIGRTGATASLTEIAGTAPVASGGEMTLVLQTAALMIDGAAVTALTMAERYAAYFALHLDGALLKNFYARRSMAGGYAGMRYRPYGSPYYPFILTEPGSVFRLELPDDKARQAAAQALRFGLPPALLDGKTVTWETCPYVPENGYGEVRAGIPGELADSGLTKAEAVHVR